jgi:Xaa-Pro dipeptidase
MVSETVDYQARRERLLDTTGADVAVIVPGANMVYFTGLHLHLSERPTLAFLSRDGLACIMPKLEMNKLHERPDLDAQAFAWSDDSGYAGAFRQAVHALELDKRRFGVDGQTMRVFEWLALQRHGADTAHADDIGQTLLDIRARKTPAEVQSMREAIRISEEALQRVLNTVQPGDTERQIAQQLEQEMMALGAEGFAFESLVLTGDNSANPHGSTGARPLETGEFLLIDFGARINGYPADITRTFCAGTPSGVMQAIYEAVRQANQAARELAAPGVTCGAVDAAARDVIKQAGYGADFTHRTGHGLGLDVHELPQIAAENDSVLQPGMVFTIEPGIYIEGVGGVRIEDNVLITENGAESLTSFPRELQLL